MKIRLEKVEIEFTSDFVDTISQGLLRLKQFDAAMDAQEHKSRNSLLAGLITATLNMMTSSLFKKDEPAAAAGGTPPPDGEQG